MQNLKYIGAMVIEFCFFNQIKMKMKKNKKKKKKKKKKKGKKKKKKEEKEELRRTWTICKTTFTHITHILHQISIVVIFCSDLHLDVSQEIGSESETLSIVE